MKKVLILLWAVVLLILVFAGCGQASADDTQQSGDVSEPVSNEPSADETASVGNASVTAPNTPAGSYIAFAAAKSTVLVKLTKGLAGNTQTAAAKITMLGVDMADLMMLPASLFGAGQEAAAAELAKLSATDIKYSENGNTYTITYLNQSGDTNTFSGTYDAAADALVCTAQINGKDSFASEYRRTPYGYVSQYFFISSDGTTNLYRFVINGEDGAFGVSATQTSQPAALTGDEPVDFPTALAEWYSITGSTITGVMANGTEVNFEYTPSATE